MDYNQTVHLPQTDFPMRAGLPKREPALLNGEWEVATYHKLMAKNADKPKFVLHDGPPYANGHIHIGTALNKILKDIIVRYKNMTGFQAPYVPGWDTHGLPIESAILKDKKIKRDELTDSEFRDKCRDFALRFVDIQRSEFQRLGVIGDWENPYLTLKPEFEAKQIEIFGKMAEKGYIYKGMKPVYWCPSDQTALAEAEIEYQDDPCTTIFVKFPVADDQGKLGQYADLAKISFVIWTTTPWTIPGNYAICVNAAFDYVLLQVPSGEVYIMAEELAKGVCAQAGIDYAACTVLATLKGEEFELMTARHPLFDRESVLLCGDHVTLDAGTGCVHTAPGFGADDFNICRAYDEAGKTHIGTPVPVNAKGVMTDERYNGQFYAAANDQVVVDLDACGALLAKEAIGQGGHHPLLPPLLAVQAPHHLPGHRAVVLLRGRHQGRRRQQLRRHLLAPRLGQGPHDLHDLRAQRLVHLPPAQVGRAHPHLLLRPVRGGHRHPRDHRPGVLPLPGARVQHLV